MASLIDNEVENCYKKRLQLMLNNLMHAKNGNKKQVEKTKAHIKLGQLNKGHSNFSTSKDLIVDHIEKEKPDVLTLGEANIKSDEPNLTKDFKDYTVETKFLKDQDNARIAVFVHKDVIYERLKDYENEINPMIVLKIRISSRQYLHLVCIYRQWNLLSNLKTPTSHKLKEQMARLDSILEVVKELRDNNKQVVLNGDINIDLLDKNDPNSKYNLRKLTEKYKEVIDDTGLCQMNFKPTRFQANSEPSLLDHYFTSNPNKMDNIETKTSIIADHKYIKANYHCKILKRKQQFRRTRNFSLLNSDILTKEIENNAKLQEIFSLEDPDEIANVMVAELNRIVEDIAPSRIIQVTNKSQPWQNKETKEAIHDADKSLNNAIKYNDIVAWNLYRKARNKAIKKMKKAKTMHFIELLGKPNKNFWNEIKKFKDNDGGTTPVRIVEGQLEITSNKQLAKRFNQYFIEKIERIERTFKESPEGAIPLLEKTGKTIKLSSNIESPDL